MNRYAIEVDCLTVLYDQKPVLMNVACKVTVGSLCAVIGPNGAGKSTLIKTVAGIVKPFTGRIRASGVVAYVPQHAQINWRFPLSVYDVVMMGRYNHQGWLKKASAVDDMKVREALDTVQLGAYIDRPIAHLSGGQQRRLFLARALAQEADLLLLDEPFAGVDLVTERFILTFLQQLTKQGKTVVMVHHDIHTAQIWCNEAILLNKQCIGWGSTAHLFTADLLSKTYNKDSNHIF